MSVVFLGCEYFQIPKAVVRLGLLGRIKESTFKVYVTLAYEAQQISNPQLAFTPKELQERTQLSANSISVANSQLQELGLAVVSKDRVGLTTYSLCNPETGEPLTKPNKNAFAHRARFNATGRYLRLRDLNELTREQYETYFRSRLEAKSPVLNGRQLSAQCPFHSDTHPSLSVNVENGCWVCHGCRKKGRILDFELNSTNSPTREAIKNIFRIAEGREPEFTSRQIEATYDYCDDSGNLLFQKVRWVGKEFSFRRPTRNGAWSYTRKGVAPVLYNLPLVIAATHVIVCEGEKDANSLSSLDLKTSLGLPIAATTNPDGAGRWQDHFCNQLAGKKVLVIPDNDDAGIEHGDEVLMSIRENAPDVQVDIKILPNLEVKDVSDYLEHHTKNEFIEMIGREWFSDSSVVRPEKTEATLVSV